MVKHYGAELHPFPAPPRRHCWLGSQAAPRTWKGTAGPGLRVADPPKIIGDAIARMKERLKKQAELQQQSQ